MNTDVKEILSSTEDDIEKLIEERASFLKNNLRFDTQYKVIYSLMLYVNIYYIYSGERENYYTSYWEPYLQLKS